MSPLHWAADGGHVDTVKCLIEKGADVNCKDEYEVSECDCATDWISTSKPCSQVPSLVSSAHFVQLISQTGMSCCNH